MSAEILRHAAALMRSRAEASQQFITDQERDWWSPEVLVSAFTAWTGEEPGQVIWGVDKDAAHLAPWHPAVALAVADWIDSHARDLASADGHLPSCDSPGDVDAALAVAAAYLGVDQ